MRTKRDVPPKVKRTIAKLVQSVRVADAIALAGVPARLAELKADRNVEGAFRKPTKKQRKKEAKRIEKATAFKIKPTHLRHPGSARFDVALFAARQLVEGKAVMLSDDSVLAMAQFIYVLHINNINSAGAREYRP